MADSNISVSVEQYGAVIDVTVEGSGPRGPKGDTGDRGAQGVAGTSACQAAQKGGYTGSEADFDKQPAEHTGMSAIALNHVDSLF